MLRRLLREIAAHDDSNASFMAAQQARIAVLEQNIDKLTKKRGVK